MEVQVHRYTVGPKLGVPFRGGIPKRLGTTGVH